MTVLPMARLSAGRFEKVKDARGYGWICQRSIKFVSLSKENDGSPPLADPPARYRVRAALVYPAAQRGIAPRAPAAGDARAHPPCPRV